MNRITRHWQAGLILLLVLAGTLGGCLRLAPDTRTLDFFIQLSEAPPNEIEMTLGVIRPEPSVHADASGQFKLWGPDGELRASGQAASLAGRPGEETIMTWRGELEPGTYELNWGARGHGGVIAQFQVLEQDEGRITLGEIRQYHTDTFPTTWE